jgi:hypothetical protein
MNIDLINHIAATIRRVDGDHTMGAGALAEAIVADGLDKIEEAAALKERLRIVGEIRAFAEKIRRESYTETTGIALGSVVDSVADHVNTYPLTVAAPADPIAELRAEFAEAHADGASSNDIAQLLDDWLVKHGQPTVLYA